MSKIFNDGVLSEVVVEAINEELNQVIDEHIEAHKYEIEAELKKRLGLRVMMMAESSYSVEQNMNVTTVKVNIDNKSQ